MLTPELIEMIKNEKLNYKLWVQMETFQFEPKLITTDTDDSERN